MSSRALTAVAVLSLVGVVGLSACGGPKSTDSADSAGGSQGGVTPGVVPAGKGQQDAPADNTTVGGNPDLSAAIPGAPADARAPQGAPHQLDLVTGEALIKTGSIALQSDDIGHVLTQVYGIVGGVGGDISREDTSTNRKGKAVRSALVVRVPVDEFDSTLNDLSRLGTLVNRVRNSKDVTTEVVDVDSRVRSAQRSINTLRQLFGQATKLGDIIRLESELSQREADLESLQAEQRALKDKTTMSTITLTLELPPIPPKPKPTPKKDDKAGGFVSGIHQGWHALQRTGLAIGHGIGVVLPLGTVALLLGALGYWFVRRFGQHSAPASQETAEV